MSVGPADKNAVRNVHAVAAGTEPSWLRASSWIYRLVVLGIFLAGVASRVHLATATVMHHADEGMHLDTGSFTSLADVLAQVRVAHAHPPLYFVLLHVCMAVFGDQLVVHRLINIALITASAWFLHAWQRQLWGGFAALLGLILYFHSPALTLLSMQVRGYALLLFGVCGTLHYWERYLASKRTGACVGFILFLGVACFAHYSAVFFAAGLSLYTWTIALQTRPRQPALRAWVLGNLALVAVYALYWIWHLQAISPRIQTCATTYLARGLYSRGDQPLLQFLTRANASLVRYLFGRSEVVVATAYALFAIVAVTLLLRRQSIIKSSLRLITALLLPIWLLSLVAAALGAYPHFGLRHSIFLLPIGAAVATLGLLRILEWRPKLRYVALIALCGWAGYVSPALGSPTLLDDTFRVRELKSYSSQHLRDAQGQLTAMYQAGDLVVLTVGDNFYFRYYGAPTADQRWPHYPYAHLGQHRIGQFDVFVVPAWAHPFNWSDSLAHSQWKERLGAGHSIWFASFNGEPPSSAECPEGFTLATKSYGQFSVARLWQPTAVTSTVP